MIRDAAFGVVILFMVAIGFVIVYMVADGFNTGIQGYDVFDTSSELGVNAQDVMQTHTTNFSAAWDWVFVTVFFGVLLGILGLSWVLRSDPIIFFALLIIVVVLGGVAGYFANAWITIAEDSSISAVLTSWPKMDFIISNYLIFVVVETFLMLIVFFAKPGGEYA